MHKIDLHILGRKTRILGPPMDDIVKSRPLLQPIRL